MSLTNVAEALTIRDNWIYTPAGSGLSLHGSHDYKPRQISITNNRLKTVGIGINLVDTHQVQVQANLLTNLKLRRGTIGIAITAKDPTMPLRGVSVRHNDIKEYSVGVQTAAYRNHIVEFMIRDNCLDLGGIPPPSFAIRLFRSENWGFANLQIQNNLTDAYHENGLVGLDYRVYLPFPIPTYAKTAHTSP